MCKVSDFGLARDVYQGNVYEMKSRVRTVTEERGPGERGEKRERVTFTYNLEL